MNLSMRIRNIKCVKDLTFSFPLESGIYAITGENGSGKSTLISCASTVFYQMPMTEYFGRPNNASIEFSLGNATRRWIFNGQKWYAESSEEKDFNNILIFSKIQLHRELLPNRNNLLSTELRPGIFC